MQKDFFGMPRNGQLLPEKGLNRLSFIFLTSADLPSLLPTKLDTVDLVPVDHTSLLWGM